MWMHLPANEASPQRPRRTTRPLTSTAPGPRHRPPLWLCRLIVSGLAALMIFSSVATSVASADPPPSTAVTLSSAQMRQGLDVAAVTGYLDQAGGGLRSLDDLITQEIIGQQPSVDPLKVAGAVTDLLHAVLATVKFPKPGEATSADAALGANQLSTGALFRDLDTMDQDLPQVEQQLDPATAQALQQGVKDVGNEALNDVDAAVPGNQFNPDQAQSPVPLSFTPQQVAEQTQTQTAQDPKLASAIDAQDAQGSGVTVDESLTDLENSAPVKSNPQLVNDVSQFSGSPAGQSISTDAGAVTSAFEGEVDGMQDLTGTAADDVRSFAGNQITPQQLTSDLNTAQSDLGDRSAAAAFDTFVTEQSGIESSAETAGEDLGAIAEEEVADVAVDAGVDLAAAEIDPAMLMNLATQGPQMLTTLINALSGTPSPDQVIIEMLQQIEKQITDLTINVNNGFAAVDAGIVNIDTQLQNISSQLTQTNQGVGEARQTLAQLAGQLDKIEFDLWNIASTQRNEQLLNDVSTDLGYSVRAPGNAQLPFDQFNEGAATFFNWATTDPTDAISELSFNPSLDSSTASSLAPDSVFGQLAPTTSGSSNLLNANLDYLAAYADCGPAATNASSLKASYACTQPAWANPPFDSNSPLSPSLPNPDVWAAGANAFSQLLTENPQYVTPPLLDEVKQIAGVGDTVSSTLSAITAPGAGAAPISDDGTTIDTGSGILNNALHNYLKQGIDGPANLLTEFEAEKNNFLSGQNPGGQSDPTNCTACTLGVPPTDGANTGEASIDLWGGPDQAPQKSLNAFQTTSDPSQPNNGTGKAGPGTMNECTSSQTDAGFPYLGGSAPATIDVSGGGALLNPLPAVYANAWHLGLGRIIGCYEGAWGNQPNFITGQATIDVGLNWYWQSATTGKETQVLHVAGIVPITFCRGATFPPTPITQVQDSWTYGGTGANPFSCTAVTSGILHVSLEQIMQEAAAAVSALPPGTVQSCPFALCVQPPGSPVGVFVTYTWPSPSNVPAAAPLDGAQGQVQNALSGLQRQLYQDIEPSGNATYAGFGAAVNRLNGARALIDDYVQLGMPTSLETDPLLRALVFGFGAGPQHLLDNSGDQLLYNYFQGLIANPPAADPATSGALEGMMTSGVQQLADRIELDLSSSGGGGGGGGGAAREARALGAAVSADGTPAAPDETDPLVSAALARLDITANDVLANPNPNPSPAPVPAPNPNPNPGPAPVSPPLQPVASTAVVHGAHAHGATITLTLRCRNAMCHLNAQALTTEHGKRGVRKTVTVASRSLTLNAGQTATITVKLNHAGSRLLKKSRRLPITVKVTLVQPGGKKLTILTRRLTLTVPSPARHGRR